MTYKPTNPLDSIATTIICTSRDIMNDKEFAWLYLIVTPDIHHEILDEVINRFGWHSEKERIIQLNQQFKKMRSE